jgi:hypothetical protein
MAQQSRIVSVLKVSTGGLMTSAAENWNSPLDLTKEVNQWPM